MRKRYTSGGSRRAQPQPGPPEVEVMQQQHEQAAARFAVEFKKAVAACTSPQAVYGLLSWVGGILQTEDAGRAHGSVLALQAGAKLYPELKPFADFMLDQAIQDRAEALRKAIAG